MIYGVFYCLRKSNVFRNFLDRFRNCGKKVWWIPGSWIKSNLDDPDSSGGRGSAIDCRFTQPQKSAVAGNVNQFAGGSEGHCARCWWRGVRRQCRPFEQGGWLHFQAASIWYCL